MHIYSEYDRPHGTSRRAVWTAARAALLALLLTGLGSVYRPQAALRAGMQGGRAYFNIHSTNFPGGEIRGFLYALRVFLPLIRR